MILLTGITGNNGSATATALLDKGEKFRALVRDLDKAADWAAKGVELVQGDLNDPASVRAAMEGIDSAVLIQIIYCQSCGKGQQKNTIFNFRIQQ